MLRRKAVDPAPRKNPEQSSRRPSSPSHCPKAEQTNRSPFPFQPRLTLRSEVVLLEEDEGERETQAAVAELAFDYDGLICHPEDEDDFEHGGASRDRVAEARAARILESLGATELCQLSGLLPDFDSTANYFITFSDEVHVGCSFAAHAVPELIRLGFVVAMDASFPFDTLPESTGWYGSIEPDEKLDWFVVELGIEIDGKSYNLVPSLLELLEQCAEGVSFEALAHCRARFRAVPLGDGRYVVLPWERLERILAVLSDLYPDDGRVRQELPLPMARVAELTDLDEAFGETGPMLNWLAGTDWLERSRSLKEGPTWSPQPAALRATLRPYQHEGLMWLEHKRDAGVGGVLADDMGLGKTLQTIALLCREKEARRLDIPSLIVGPTSLVQNWRREFEKFAPHIRVLCYTGARRHKLVPQFENVEVIVTSYPVLIRDMTPLTDREWHYVILDEAQAIKNARSLASTAVRTLSARHRLAITGTPVENNLDELWSLFEFTHPGLLGRAAEFRKHFRDPVERLGDEVQLQTLRKRVAPFILRRVKESVARDLPPKTELVRAVELRGAQRDLYESIRLAADSDVRQAIARKGIAGSAVTILDALMKLRQVCADPRIVPMQSARAVQDSAKYELFFELLENQLNQGRRVLVFSQFARMLGLLGKGLTERAHKYLCLTGASQDRQGLVDQFEAKAADVFLISLKAGGTGLNLVSADTVIHYDPWWNAAAQMQATDRAYRIGQKKPVFVYNLIAASSVEETMLSLQRKKRSLADTILGDVSAQRHHEGRPLHETFSQDDVDDLFAPLDPSGTTDEATRWEVPAEKKVCREDDDENALAPRSAARFVGASEGRASSRSGGVP